MAKKYVDTEVVEKIISYYSNSLESETEKTIVDAIKDVFVTCPSADVEEVKHGKWVVIKYQSDIDSCLYEKYKCSVCGAIEYRKYEYCHCGAKMDGIEN